MEFKSGYNFMKQVQKLKENGIVQLHEKGTNILYSIEKGEIDTFNKSTCKIIKTENFNNDDVLNLNKFLDNLGVKDRKKLTYRVLHY